MKHRVQAENISLSWFQAKKTNMKQIISMAAYWLLFITVTIAQPARAPLSEAKPETAGVSAQRLQRLDLFLQKYIDDRQFNGATAIIIRDGKIIYHKAFGYSDMEKKKAMQKDDIFRIASMTKPLISVGAMMLCEEGRFSLDDPISKYIPEFKDARVLDKYNPAETSYTTVPAKSEITVRQVMSQSSGIGYAQIGSAEANAIYFKNGINGGIGTPNSTLREMIPRLAKLPLFSHPGEKYLYGLNTDVLGYLIEVVSGMPLDKYMQQRIFGPLGMKDTWFFLPADRKSRLVQLYQQDKNGVLRLQDPVITLNGDFHRDFPLAQGGSYFSGGAGLSSTAYDYALFCQMMLNGGEYNGVRILSPHSIRMMTTNQIGDLPMWGGSSSPNRFGLGFGVYTEKSEAVTPVRAGTYDWAGMFASHFWIDPKSRMACIFMRNIWPTTTWDFGDRVKTVVYQALND
jgi:CubicO group peptidase (beta-lactamase class C family)